MTDIQPLATFTTTITAGVLSLILGSKLRVPSILFFLVFGIVLGPEFLNLIQPDIFRSNFPHYISLMVALILFEGGSSLKIAQLKEISHSLRNLLTIGVLITLAGVSLAVYGIAHMSWKKAILFGSIMVVTGPTVVIPILRRIRIQQKIHNILKWESILIDPLGVILAVVLFEFLILQHGGVWDSILLFGARFLLGIFIGWLAGALMVLGLTKRWLLLTLGEELGGLFVLALTLFAFGVSEAILSESGLVTVTVAGLYFGNKKFPFSREVDHFKDQVVLFALSVLFVLLASNIPMREAAQLRTEGLWLIVVMVLFIRPFSVWISTARDKTLTWKEKIFLSFMAPRGIVSASLASLFALEFETRALTGRGIFLPLAFYVISGTIVVYAVLSEVMARLTGVKEGKHFGIMIVGANPLGLSIARELRELQVPVKLIDSNTLHCAEAQKLGFEVYEGSGFDGELLEALDIKGISKMIAVTPNHEVNVLSCQTFSRYLKRESVYRIWDKNDDWQTVSSIHYDASWGKPVYLPEKLQGDRVWNIAKSGQLSFGHFTLSKTLKVTEEIVKNQKEKIPLFGVKEEVFFFSPHTVFPEGCRAVSVD